MAPHPFGHRPSVNRVGANSLSTVRLARVISLSHSALPLHLLRLAHSKRSIGARQAIRFPERCGCIGCVTQVDLEVLRVLKGAVDLVLANSCQRLTVGDAMTFSEASSMRG